LRLVSAGALSNCNRPRLNSTSKGVRTSYAIGGCARCAALDILQRRAFFVCASGRNPLQRLFSTFPGGQPGIGLLLIRAALGGIAVALGASDLSGLIERTLPVWAVGLTFLVSGAGIIIGFMTPLASLLVGLGAVGIILSWIPAPPLASLGTTLIALLVVMTAMGIALLGPGAFSIDGNLFGRREIVIPPRSPRP